MNLDGDFTVTVSNGTTTAAQLAKIDAKTSKNVDASAVTAISVALLTSPPLRRLRVQAITNIN